MPASLTATVQTAGGYIDLALAGVTPQTAALVVRIDSGGNEVVVRNGDPAPIFSQAWSGSDYEAPLDSAVTYSARDTGTGAQIAASSAVTLASDGRPWLGHPGKPSMNFRPTVARFTPGTRQARAMVHHVLGRTLPVGQSLRRAAASGVLVLRGADAAALSQINSILDDGHVLLYRAPATWVGHGSRYLQIADVDFEPLIRWAEDGRFVITLPWTEVARPAGLAQGGPGYRWVDVYTLYDTWADVIAANPTWANVIDGVQ